jgi:hypothetical protein
MRRYLESNPQYVLDQPYLQESASKGGTSR